MTPEQIQERFMALLELVESVHARCKADPETVESLIDNFYQCHFLMQSFMTDCSELLHGLPAIPQLQITVMNINNALHCSISHLVDNQEKLGTRVVTDIIKNFTASAENSDPSRVN